MSVPTGPQDPQNPQPQGSADQPTTVNPPVVPGLPGSGEPAQPAGWAGSPAGPPPGATPPPGSPPPGGPTGGGFWQSNTTRVIAIVAGALVGCLVLGGVALAAVAAGSLGDGHRMMGNQSNRFDGNGPMGRHGQGNGPGNGQGNGRGGQNDDGSGRPNGPGPMMGRGGMMSEFPGIQHGDVVVTGTDGKPTTKRIIRGTVTAVTPASITVKAADGYVGEFAIASTTQFTVNGQQGAATGLAVGQGSFVIGTVSGTAATADRIAVVAAGQQTP